MPPTDPPETDKLSPQEAEEVINAIREIERHPPPAPIFAIPGNHDIEADRGRDLFVERNIQNESVCI